MHLLDILRWSKRHSLAHATNAILIHTCLSLATLISPRVYALVKPRRVDTCIEAILDVLVIARLPLTHIGLPAELKSSLHI